MTSFGNSIRLYPNRKDRGEYAAEDCLSEWPKRKHKMSNHSGADPLEMRSVLTVQEQQLVSRVDGDSVDKANKSKGTGVLNCETYQVLGISGSTSKSLIKDLNRVSDKSKQI